MKTKIIGTVPTHYQSQSLRAFGLDVFHRNLDGSITAHSNFDTIKEAREWLKIKGEQLYDDKPLKELRANRGKDWLRYDAAQVEIEKQ